jgi:peptidoglycan/xylan/chitin deacetylase (PgdA/CDA1 family)
MFENFFQVKINKILFVTILVISLISSIFFLSPSVDARRNNNWKRGGGSTQPQPTQPLLTKSSGIISVEFDDGWKSAYTNGLPILNKYNIKTTQAVISQVNNNNPAYITDSEIRNYSNQGHQIASHSVIHPSLPSLTDSQMRAELLNSRNRLQEIIGKRVPYFVAPYCEFGSREINVARDYYQVARNCFTGSDNTPSSINISNLDSKIVEQSTSISTINSWIDNAKRNNSLLILVYHKVGPGTNDAYSVTPQTLDSHMSIVSKSGLKIQTTMDALRTMGKI